MADADNIGRINIWRNSTIAASAAAAERGTEALGRMSIYRSEAIARSRRHHEVPAGGGGGYTASAVHFDGDAWLDIASLTATDNDKFSVAFWFKASPVQGADFFVTDPNGGYTTQTLWDTGKIEVQLGNAAGDTYFILGTSGNPDATWHCLIASGETNHADGLKPGKLYLDDVDVTVPQDGVGAFTMAFNGLEFVFGSDTFGSTIVGDIADVRIMPGVSLLVAGDIPEATRRLFIDANGKPVDPATATATLGAPRILFSGDATGFATNQGTGGTFTLTGSLTNASTSPSD